MRLVEVAAGQARPIGLVDALRVDFLLPQDLNLFALRIVFETREPNQRLVAWVRGGLRVLDEVAPRPDADNIPRFRGTLDGCVHGANYYRRKGTVVERIGHAAL